MLESDVMGISLEIIEPSSEHIKILYQHLQNRTHHISNTKKTSFEKHKKFVKNHPYRVWFMVKEGNEVLGNVYVKYDNSIGLYFSKRISNERLKEILRIVGMQLSPLDAIASVRNDKFHINVASSNIDLQNKLVELGLEEIQRTYTIDLAVF
jgi:arsenate reductase-like glutaredoxin family protein